ncbi:hypothetical protein SAMD00079811_17230 [Scytonema sp. HK-05]|uniref:DUF1349 domain-containing protein n=1 Tax=Scytonema sp. HK-05 TaxID=1137095 RepID=UPI0009360600|nr:DUF1349 domain-containing protein [Scytonema sp. HK-05]OKH56822.1 hypothetical protein NIES2130_23105 [Scytonema sp. HK-05]BAY44129.1 hypothetical protein SAMD00079811_17230 [Scytonema sp. HK-05]
MNKLERLNETLDGLQQEWKLHNDKAKQLRMAFATETSANADNKFLLEQKINFENAQLQSLDQKIQDVEKQIEQMNLDLERARLQANQSGSSRQSNKTSQTSKPVGRIKEFFGGSVVVCSTIIAVPIIYIYFQSGNVATQSLTTTTPPTPTPVVNDYPSPTSSPTQTPESIPQEIPFTSSPDSRDLNQKFFTWKRGSSSSSRYSLTPSGVLSITAGAGTDIVGSINTAPLVTYPFNGDFEVQVKVMFNSTINNQRAGLGIRSTDAQNNHLRIYKLENKRIEGYLNLQHKKQYPLNIVPYEGETVYFRIRRQGRDISMFYSSNGSNWVSLGNENLEIPQEVEIFLFVLSANNPNTATAQFSDFVITRL